MSDATNEVFSRFEVIKTQSTFRLECDEFYSSLYHDSAYQGYTGDVLDFASVFAEGINERLNENHIFRITSTVCAKLAKNKVRPNVVTDGANWEWQQEAKMRERFIWGVMQQNQIYTQQRQSNLGMLLRGTGVLGVDFDGESITIEEVPSSELFVDAASARYRKPRTMFRRYFVDREELLAKYDSTEAKRLLQSARKSPLGDIVNVGGNQYHDMIEVVGMWRLPILNSNGELVDGRRTFAIREGYLFDDKTWKRRRHPFAVVRYELAPRGFFGIGLVANLVGLQLELNRTLEARQDALYRLGRPYIAVDRASKVTEGHLGNKRNKILYYTGVAPREIAPSVIAPETFTHSTSIKEAMFGVSGVSQFAASAIKPAGVDSGRAIRAYSDFTDDNFHDIMTRIEQQIVDVAELILDEAETAHENGEDVGVVYRDELSVEKINFKDTGRKCEQFIVTVMPASSLQSTLTGKLEDIGELEDKGLIETREEKLELLGMPDLISKLRRKSSMVDTINHVLNVEILRKGKMIIPESSWNLQLCLTMCRDLRLDVSLRGCPEDKIQLLREFEKQCAARILQANGTMQQQQIQEQIAPAAQAEQSPAQPVGMGMPNE